MSASNFSPDATHSVFEALRPEPGETLDQAAFATYSLDLVTIAALVLSLGRAGEQELDAGPLALIDAFETVLPRIDIVHQADRLKAAPKHFGVLHMLDRRLHSVLPPRGSSFHPKLALVRYVGPKSAAIWRLWIGSRNLTGGQDREAGLLLVGRAARRRAAPGAKDASSSIAAMAEGLLKPVAWVAYRKEELAGIRWRAPDGVGLRGVQWRRAGERKAFATSLRGSVRAVALSPFVDDEGLGLLGGGQDDLLLTTIDAAAMLNPRPGTSIATCRPPTFDLAMPVGSEDAAPPVDDVSVPELGGLHAKLLLRRGAAGDRLWIGSANLTRRGMLGPNAEVLAELDVSGEAADALAAFALDGEPFDSANVASDSEAATRRAAERALDEALAAVAGATFELRREKDDLVLASLTPLDDFLAEHRLEAWLLTRPDAVASWRESAAAVTLVPGGVPLRLETVLVGFRAWRAAEDCPPRSWAQAVPFPGHDADARDRAATAAYIGLAGAGAWLRSQLAGIVSAEPTTWTGAARWPGSEFAGAVDEVPLALEEILAAWARDPDVFENRARDLEGTLAALVSELVSLPEDERDDGAVARWGEVVEFWAAIRAATGVPA